MGLGHYVRRLARLTVVVIAGYLVVKGWQASRDQPETKGADAGLTVAQLDDAARTAAASSPPEAGAGQPGV